MKKLLVLGLSLALMLTVLTGCGGSTTPSGTIVTHDGTTTEPQLVYRVAKLLIEEYTDATLDIRDQMSGVNLYKQLTAGDVDLMNCYDGSLLTTYLKLDTSDVPAGSTVYDYARQEGIARDGVLLLGQMGHDNTYALGITDEVKARYDITTVSELVEVAPELVFVAEHEFYSEEGSMKFGPFTDFYGLRFKEARSVDVMLKYAAVETGDVDVLVVYTTDGLNRKANLFVLEDNRNYFPDYNGCLLVRTDTFEKFADVAPNLEEVLAMMEGIFTNEIMTELTYRVDVLGENLEAVAKEHLTNLGLLPS